MPFRRYRRNLPHWRDDEATYHVVWRLHHAQRPLDSADRALILAALQHFDGVRYTLHGFAIMDDHVHVVIKPAADWRLEDILHSWKSFTAHQLVRRGRTAPVWQDEYFDRLLRNEADWRTALAYVAANPIARWPGLPDGAYPFAGLIDDLDP